MVSEIGVALGDDQYLTSASMASWTTERLPRVLAGPGWRSARRQPGLGPRQAAAEWSISQLLERSRSTTCARFRSRYGPRRRAGDHSYAPLPADHPTPAVDRPGDGPGICAPRLAMCSGAASRQSRWPTIAPHGNGSAISPHAFVCSASTRSATRNDPPTGDTMRARAPGVARGLTRQAPKTRGPARRTALRICRRARGDVPSLAIPAGPAREATGHPWTGPKLGLTFGVMPHCIPHGCCPVGRRR
jgi:hypothetical protein